MLSIYKDQKHAIVFLNSAPQLSPKPTGLHGDASGDPDTNATNTVPDATARGYARLQVDKERARPADPEGH